MSGEESGRVLALDSCGAETTLCLGVTQGDSAEIVRSSSLPARTAGARLTGALRDLLGGLRPSALQAMVVVRGPGSFAGMRVGLSAAKALSEATGVPLAAVSRLAVLAGIAGDAQTVLLDAGRGSVYVRTLATGDEKLMTAEQAHAQLGIGSAAAVCEDKTAAAFRAARRVSSPTADDALRHAVQRVLTADWDDTETLDALYLWQAVQMLKSPGA